MLEEGLIRFLRPTPGMTITGLGPVEWVPVAVVEPEREGWVYRAARG